MKTYRAFKGGIPYESKEEMFKALETLLRSDREIAKSRYEYAAKREATYHFIRLISAFVRINGGWTMEKTDEYVSRRMKCKMKSAL